jgi:hypothetical protein
MNAIYTSLSAAQPRKKTVVHTVLKFRRGYCATIVSSFVRACAPETQCGEII